MTQVADRTQQMHPVPQGASAQVETTDAVRITTPPKICGMGHRMKRKEDPRFIQGHGNYVDDVKLPGMLYLDIVRSPYAHAKILKIDASAALAMPGVLAVITGEDLKKAGNLHWMPTLMSDTQMVLPIEKVVYYAQEVAAVIATDRYIAADAIEKVVVDYEPLDVVVDPFEALKDRVIVRDDKTDRTNHIWHWEAGDAAATDRVFKEAAKVVKQSLYLPRIHVSSIETCGMVAHFDKITGKLKMWMTSQAPHAHRTVFALVSGLPEQNIQIISPDIGGGFGGKVPVYPGYVCCAVASIVTGLPVKWIEDRSENLQADSFARDYHIDAEMALDANGRITGLRVKTLADHGCCGCRGESVQVPRGPVQHLHRQLRHEGGARGGGRRVHQQAAGRRCLPLLVPRHGSRAHDRAHGGHRGPRAGRRSRGIPPAQLHPAGPVPVQVAHRLGIRFRQLRSGAAQGHEGDRLRRTAPRAGGEASARRADGHRHLQLHGSRGRRSVP